MNTMPASRPCPQCGSPIPAGASEGLCPRCLLALNLAAQSHMAGDTQPPAGSQAVPPLSLEEVAKLFPQLEIIRLVGTGGMGAVYQARQPALDRFVALKLLHTPPANDPGFAERFAQEARALAKLNHPNIVALYESGQAGGRPYFLMEFVDGLNLRQLQQAGRLSPREALQIVPQVCDALQYAHDEGIVHRDIKPENVLLDRKGRVKVADFGLAKLMGRETAAIRLTGAGHTMGTPHYMAPEQVEHPLEVDHRADIFSLGVVFYELLTGELPLGKFPVPSKKVRIDVRLDEVVLRALEKEPALRYGQASELKTQVETISGAPAMAGPPVMEPEKFKRTRGQILTGSFSLALMAVGMAINITPFQPYGLAILIWGVPLAVVAAVMASLAKTSSRKLKGARDITIINGIGLFSAVIPLALDCPWMLRTNSHVLIIAACGIGIVVGVLKLFNAGPFKTKAEPIARLSEASGSLQDSADDGKKERSLRGWAWRFMPAVAVFLAFFNPWGMRAWYYFAAACAVIAVLPPLRFSRRPGWVGLIILIGVVVPLALIFHGRTDIRHLSTFGARGVAQKDELPQLRALAWLDETKNQPDWIGWRPSGEQLRKADMQLPDWIATPAGVDVSGTKAAGDEPRFLCMWFSHPQFDAQSVAQVTLLDDKGKPLEVPSKEWSSGVSPAQSDTQNLGWITATLCAGRRGHTPDFATVQLRYSAGAWQFWDELSPDFTGFRALGNGVQLTPPGQAADGRTFVMLTHDLGKDTGVEQIDFVAILKDGRRLERTGHSDSGSDTVRNERFIFDTPVSQVKTFQIRKRSVQQMTWTVTLRADATGAAVVLPSDSAQAWLSLMDGGQYAQSWDAAAESFHSAVTQAEWTSESEKIRRPLGDVLSRKLVTTQETKTFPGMPDGAYWLAEYDTAFAGQKSAAETVVLMREKDGHWRAISYLIRPRTDTERTAVMAARAWLTSIDEGHYAESWSAASAFFREAPLTQEKWVDALKDVRQPLDARIFRTVNATKTTSHLPGAPAGTYVVMQFDASFAEDKSAVETVTFMLEKDGVWRAAGYFIK